MAGKQTLIEKLNLLKALLALYQKLLALTQKRPTLKELAEAMAKFEGFYLINSRANRNNNPGNLKWSSWAKGYDKDNFAIFETKEKGWEAFLWDLGKKCKGETRTNLTPESTIKDLIYVWTTTDQKDYTNFICERLGIAQNYKLKNLA